MESDPNYQNISVLNPIQQFLMPQLQTLREGINPSSTDDGDGISALVIAIQMIIKYCKKLKYTRNIYLVTNGAGLFEQDETDEIVARIKSEGINLTVLYVKLSTCERGVH